MSRKIRSPLFDYLVYFAVRMLICVLQALSFDTARQLARFLAWAAYQVDRRHRRVAMENLQAAFPGQYTEAELDTITRSVFQYFCGTLIEIVHMPRRYHLHNYKKYTRLCGSHKMIEALLAGRPVLCVTGHFGNWEMAGYTLGLFGFHAHAIARPLDNPYLDKFVRGFRQRTGQKILDKNGAADTMEKLLREGGIIATLADQDAGRRGLFVDFFGRPASTHKAIALMALEHNVPILVVGMPSIDGKFSLSAIDVIYPEDYATSPDPIRAITQRFTTDLETLIREAPDQYFWLHRRWKHTPPVRKKKAAA